VGDLRVDGVRLAYQVDGPPQAPPVLLLHALGEDATTWREVSAVLATDRRVYALDLRGHGASDRPGEYSLELMRDDVLGVLDALGLPPVSLVGHSMGAVVAYLVAQRRPAAVDQLVLEDPLPPLPADPPRPLPERPAGRLGFDWAVVPAINPQRNHPDPAWWDGLAAITARTLIVAGGPDSHLPQDHIAKMAAIIPDCAMVTVPAGHQVHTAEPARFISEVSAFLAGHGPAVQETITYLEMTSPGQLRPSRAEPAVTLEPAKPGTGLIRSTVERIGSPHGWSALSYSDLVWQDWLADARRRQWLVRCHGEVAGLAELQAHPGGDVEITTFGLVPEYVGQGFGGPALTQAVRLAWDLPPVDAPAVRRVWLHTSSFDHPHALPNYLHRGFRPFRTEQRRRG
jgi:pimeloyl-ACP methyl ester carboxylesterase/GNAT superfamily N-acetyltransferase